MDRSVALRRVLPVVLFAIGLAVLVVGPTASRTALVGHPTLDVWAHAWGADWFLGELLAGRLPWEVHGAAHGVRRVLWYIDPLGALAGAPGRLLAGPVVGWNIQLGLQVAVAALGGLAWGRALGGRGWLAGAALATAPFLQGELWNGVSESCWVGLVALAGALAARRSWSAGLMVGLAAVATPYLAVSAGLLVAFVLLLGGTDAGLAAAERGRGSFRIRLATGLLAAGAAALVAAPHLHLLTDSLASPESFVMRPLSHGGFNTAVLQSNATDPLALVHPGDFWSVPFEGDEWSVAWRRTPYLGLSILLLSVLGTLRSNGETRLGWLWAPALLGTVACLGPFLWHDGAWVQTAEGGYWRLPMWWVIEASPVSFDHPMRFVVLPVVVLAGLADAALGRWGLVLVPVVLAEHLLLAPASWPIASADASFPAVFEALPHDGAGVIDLPAETGTGNQTNAFLFWQRLHERPVPYGNKVGAMGIPVPSPIVRSWAAISKRTPGFIEGAEAGADLQASADALGALGYRWVVLHPHLLVRKGDRARHESAISAVLGAPSEVEGALVWELPADGRRASPGGEAGQP